MIQVEKVGERVREAREARGLSIEKAAVLSGVTSVTLSSFELGRSHPRIDTFLKICETLGEDPEAILRAARVYLNCAFPQVSLNVCFAPLVASIQAQAP